MSRFICLILAAFGLSHSAAAQASAPPAFARTATGIEYQLFRRDATGKFQPRALAVPGDAPYASRTGQFLTMFIEYRTGRDSVLMSSRRMSPLPQPLPLPEAPPRGGIEEAVALLLPGDSAVFRFNADSVFVKTFRQPVPPFIKKAGNTLSIYARAFEVITPEALKLRQEKLQAEAAAKAKAQAAKQLLKEDAQIQAYAKKNKLAVKKTAGGTYYAITKPGKGLPPKKGQTVSVLYRGTLLTTGKEFDASAKHGNVPFDFPLGAGQVIQGWDQGIAVLNKGAKAVLLIPSPLGYGARGAGADIPADSILRFDVELVNVK